MESAIREWYQWVRALCKSRSTRLFDAARRFYVWWNDRQFGPDVFRDAGPGMDFTFAIIFYGLPLALAGFITSLVLSHRSEATNN